MSNLTYSCIGDFGRFKPLVWLEGEIKTPPLSQAARLEAGTFFLSELQADRKGSYTRRAIYRRAKAYSGSTLEPRRLSVTKSMSLFQQPGKKRLRDYGNA